MKTDILVIGGGVIGLSMARHLAGKGRVTLIDKDTCGFHTSSRNSGVIHAGIYYTPGSSKAKYSVEGNKALTAFCKEKGVGFQNIGKIIAPYDDSYLPKIQFLYENSLKNGAPAAIIDYHEAKQIEPRIVKQEKYLWSPSTSIADNKGVIKALKADCLSLGVQIIENCKYIRNIETPSCHMIYTSQETILAKFVVSCAGLYADTVAKSFGFGQSYEILPFIGLYLYAKPGVEGFRTLVYPCPLGENEFLGVHTTNNTKGEFMLGPTATPAFWREQYSLSSFNASEAWSCLKQYFACITSPSRAFYIKLLRQELKKYNKKFIISDVSRIVEGLKVSDYPSWGAPAVFAQLVRKSDAKLIGDFIVESNERSLHLINIVSPGWTSSLAFTKDISQRINLDKA